MEHGPQIPSASRHKGDGPIAQRYPRYCGLRAQTDEWAEQRRYMGFKSSPKHGSY